MYKIFTDKSKLFKCNIDIQGSSIDECQARILIETKEKTFLYKGKVNKSGMCEVEIPKLNHLLEEGIEGKIMLEVIVENTLFNPWESDFIVTASKKVNVQVDEEEEEIVKESNIDNGMKVSIVMDEEDEIEEKKEEKKEEKVTLESKEEEKVVTEKRHKPEEKKILENKRVINKEADFESEIFDFESFFNKNNK